MASCKTDFLCILQCSLQNFIYWVYYWGGHSLLPLWQRSCPKGYLFQASGIQLYERFQEFHKILYMYLKGQGNLKFRYSEGLFYPVKLNCTLWLYCSICIKHCMWMKSYNNLTPPLGKGSQSNYRLSESFEVDSWVVKVGGQSRDILFKICHP